MVKVAICDDSVIALNEIKQIVENEFNKYWADTLLQTFISGKLLVEKHKAEPFDVIFLDINMPEMDGFKVAEELQDYLKNTFIVFVTALSEMVYKSFDFRPFHFLPKFGGEPLQTAIPKVVEKLVRHLRQNEKITLYDNEINKAVHLFYHNILYIESDKHYLKYFTENRILPIRERGVLSEKETELLQYDFIRPHKRFIVNLRHIKTLDMNNDEICLSNGNKIIMSRNTKAEVKKKFTLYLRAKT